MGLRELWVGARHRGPARWAEPSRVLGERRAPSMTGTPYRVSGLPVDRSLECPKVRRVGY